MKKKLDWIIVLSFIFLFILSIPNTVETLKDELLASQIECTVYPYCSGILNYAGVVLKNNSNFTVTIKGKILIYNELEEEIDYCNVKEYVVESGQEVGFSSILKDKMVSFKPALEVKIEDFHKPIQSSIKVEGEQDERKLIVKATNTGTVTGKYGKRNSFLL